MVIEEVPSIAMLAVDRVHQSKITIPPVSGVPRPRLIERLDRGARGKLTVISAPAGWGKSTLLAAWAHQTPMDVAWVTLDEADNNPTRYFRSVVAALDHICPMHLDDVFAMLRSPTPAINEHIDHAIISRLDDITEEIAIVFNDFHVLTNPDQLRSISRVLERLPPGIHVFIASRGDLQFPLARLRSAGDVTLLDSESVAFTATEAGEVLDQLAGGVLRPADVELLVERTEGWIAGLRLAGISIAHQPDPRSAIERFRGTHRDVADYFREEVLERFSADLRQFLIETSVFDKFSAALCNFVTGYDNAHDMIGRSASANLFLVPLDEKQTWYRYHGLFRDMLQADFQHLPYARRVELNQRAATWFEQQGMLHEAVGHALAADDFDRAAVLIDRYADALMFGCGETNLLVEWIEQLPEDLFYSRPGLLRVYAWALTTIGRLDQAEMLTNRFSNLVQDQTDDPAQAGFREREAYLAAVKARLASYRGDLQATIVHGRRAIALLDPMRHGPVHGDVLLSIGFAERALGHMDNAAEAFAEAARIGRQYGNIQAAHWGARYLAVTRIAQGRLNDAEAIIDEDFARVRKDAADPGSMLSALLVGKAEILIERNRLAEARTALDKAISHIQAVGDAKMLMNAYVAMARLLDAEGRPSQARKRSGGPMKYSARRTPGPGSRVTPCARAISPKPNAGPDSAASA